MTKVKVFALCLVVLVVLSVVGIAVAGSSARFDVFWQVLSGGGAPASGGGVSVNGSLGQPIVGQSASANYDLSAGYWLKGMYKTFLPLALKN